MNVKQLECTVRSAITRLH